MQRVQARFIIDSSLCAVIVCCFVYTSRFGDFQYKDLYIEKNNNMANFCTIRGILLLIPEELPYVDVECREVHVHSFTDS